LETNVWETYSFSKASIKPSHRAAHGACIVGDSLFVFGGSNGKKLGDLWKLDLISMVWV